MSGEVMIGGIRNRPSWNYGGTADEWGNEGYNRHTLEMIESCRNVMDQVLDELKTLNRLLGCSNFVGIPTTLRKIAEHTKPKPRKRVKKVEPNL